MPHSHWVPLEPTLLGDRIGLIQPCKQKEETLSNNQQIGALVSEHKVDMVIFLRDPLTAQPHEPDITALLRLCDVYKIPLATNLGTAELLIKATVV